ILIGYIVVLAFAKQPDSLGIIRLGNDGVCLLVSTQQDHEYQDTYAKQSDRDDGKYDQAGGCDDERQQHVPEIAPTPLGRGGWHGSQDPRGHERFQVSKYPLWIARLESWQGVAQQAAQSRFFPDLDHTAPDPVNVRSRWLDPARHHPVEH